MDEEFPGPEVGSQPERWEELAKLEPAELDRRIRMLPPLHDRLDREAWWVRLAIISHVRALKEQCTDHTVFTERVTRYGIGKTAAYDIVRYRLADRIDEIADRVEAEVSSAEAKRQPYLYPSMNKMLGWYAPPREGGQRGKADGRNDQRDVERLHAEMQDLKDAAQTLTGRAIKAEQERFEAENAYARAMEMVKNQSDTIAKLREEAAREAPEPVAASRLPSELELWNAVQAAPQAPDEPVAEQPDEVSQQTTPEPEEEPYDEEPEEEDTVADLVHTTIAEAWSSIENDKAKQAATIARWRLPALAGGKLDPDTRRQANDARVATFRLVAGIADLELRQQTAEKLAAIRGPRFWADVADEAESLALANVIARANAQASKKGG